MFNMFIYIAVIICGAPVLSLEFLGTSLIGPVFGVSLYLWSALIGVILAALSVGYAQGGWLAGAWTVAIPWLRHPMLASPFRPHYN